MENTYEFYTDINDISLIEEDGEQVVYLTNSNFPQHFRSQAFEK